MPSHELNRLVHYLIIGCGYVGRRAAVHWLKLGHQVTALTRSQNNAAQLADIGVTPVIGDVMDPASLANLPTADLLLYAVGFDRTTMHSQRDIYVQGLKHVLAQVSGRVQRIIYLSSTSVYGQTAGEWVDETSACNPSRPNGQICLDAETVLQKHGATAQVPVNVLRLAGIYGPDRLLARVAALQAGEPLRGNRAGFLNLIYVDDIVRAIVACQEMGHAGATYLVCDDQPITREEYYTTLAKIIDAPPPQFVVGDSQRHSGDSLNKRCSNRRMREELQVEPAYPTIATGLPAALRLSQNSTNQES